jgi:hypothetical protein
VSVSTKTLALHQRTFSFRSPRTYLSNDVAFPAAWAAQSRLASIAMWSFVAFSSFFTTLAVMLVWSLAATVLYFVARSYGAPDLLEVKLQSPERNKLQASARAAFTSILRIVLVGPAAFIYTRMLHLDAPGRCKRRQAQHAAVLATGATLFGVTTTHYILRKGGFKGAGLLQLSCLGAALNVTYRALLSTLIFAGLAWLVALTGVAHLL